MENAKDKLFGSLTLLALGALASLLYFIFLGPLGDYRDSLATPRTVSVSVSEKMSVKPDIARLSFSVVSEGKNTENLVSENNAKINGALEMLKELGIPSEDIETAEYNLSPVYSSPVKGEYEYVPKIVKYSLTQTVRVKMRDFAKISQILDKLPGLGINRIGNLSFGIDDEEIYLAALRDRAFVKAKEKAVNIAEAGDIRLGKIIGVYESSGSPYYPSYGKEYAGMDMGGGTAIRAPVIEPGSEDISLTVTLTYEIR